MTTRGRRCPIVAVVTAMFVTICAKANAGSENDTEAIRLSYRASEGCPDEASFVTRIRGRTTRARLAWAGETARTFTVVVEAGPPPTGRVVVQGSDRSEGVRRVQADTCSDVADALALVVALAIDPQAAAPTPAALRTVAASVPAAPIALPARRPAALFAGVDLAVATGVASKVLPAGSPYLGWRAAGATLFQPSVRLAFLRVGSGPLDGRGGKAEFVWTVGRLDVCPIVWPRGVVRVTPCARLEGGTLEGARADVSLPSSKLQPWLAVGSVARVEWSLIDWVFIDAEIGALVRMIQDRFYLPKSDGPFYEVPPVGVVAGFGVGFRFF